jgi:ribosomal protein L3
LIFLSVLIEEDPGRPFAVDVFNDQQKDFGRGITKGQTLAGPYGRWNLTIVEVDQHAHWSQ